MSLKQRLLPVTLATFLVACVGVGSSASPSGSAPATKTVDAGQVEGGGSGGFFATHPATDERIQALHRTR